MNSTAIALLGPALGSLCRPGMRATIAFTDATRRSPDAWLVGHLLEELNAGGIDDDAITLLSATGLHRPMTDAERRGKLGADVVRRIRVVDHRATDAASLVDLGAIGGIPLVVNRLCVETDLLLATGVVEPHQYAGYSGGGKTVVIGCGGEATIAATHGAAMLDREGTVLGQVEGNPFQEFVREAAERIGMQWCTNAVWDEEGGIAAAAEGPPRTVHDHLIAIARRHVELPISAPAHVAVAGVPPAKAVNLYQASRAATYLALSGARPLLDGAPIVLPAPIPEGAGEGLGERRFYDVLSAADSPAELVERLRRDGFPAGAQRAYILARTLMRHPVIVVGAERPEVVRACHMEAIATMEKAMQRARALAAERFGTDDLRVLEVPNALTTLPVVVGR